ncbi:MAG: ROK family transcriptional regulator [Chloroflexota bacterium]
MPVPAKATHGQTRDYNQRLVLRTLYDLGPVSRADVARLTGLTRTTVSEVVGGLLSTGIVEEVGRGPSSGGKAPILLSVVDDARHVIGLDLGDGAFVGAVVNLRGDASRTLELPIDGRDGAEAVALVERLVDDLVAETGGSLLGIGVGTPGVIDTRTGTISWAVNLDWQDLPLARLLSDRYGVPTHIANDSQAAALAEYAFGGDGTRPQNLVAVKVGRGIGAGIVIDGELFQGDSFGAGEIGHTVVEDDGVACRCGRFGCLETVASAPAIVTRARALGYPARDLDDVARAFEDGNEAAEAAVMAAGRSLGRVLAGVAGALDIHEIVVHGPVAALGDRWLSAVRDETIRRTLPLIADRIRIRGPHLAANEVVLGASALLMTRQLGLSLSR